MLQDEVQSLEKEILQKVEQTKQQLTGYTALASELGQNLCHYLKLNKNWDCEWHLGDYDAGVEVITLVVEDGTYCCPHEIYEYETVLGNIFGTSQDCPMYIRLRPRNTNIVDCKNHR